MNRNLPHIAFFSILIFMFSCEHVNKSLEAGNQSYIDGHYKAANGHYNKALKLDSSSFIAGFNKGDALYKQGVGLDTIQSHLEKLLESAGNDREIANLYHNIGNAQLVNKKFKKAIESYKSALRLQPEFDDSRYNLAYAKKLLPPEKDKKNQNKDRKKDKQKENKDKKKDQKQNQEKNQKKEGQNNKEEGKKDSKKRKAQPRKLTKKQAERLLKDIKRQEKGIRAKANKKKEKNPSNDENDKDW